MARRMACPLPTQRAGVLTPIPAKCPGRPVAAAIRHARGHQQVTAEGDDAPDAYGMAIDGTDERLGEVREYFKGTVLALGNALNELCGGTERMRMGIFRLAPAEKARLVIAREHHAADIVVVFHVGKVARNTLVKVVPPGVACFRSTQGDDADMIVLVVCNWHGRSPL